MPAKKAAGEAAAKPAAATKPAGEKKQSGGSGGQKAAPAAKVQAQEKQQGNQAQPSPSNSRFTLSSDPKEAALQKKLDGFEAEISRHRSALDKIQKDFDEEKAKKDGLLTQRKNLRERFHNHSDSNKEASTQRKETIDKIVEFRRVRKLKQEDANKLKQQLPHVPSGDSSPAAQEAYLKKIEDDIKVLERAYAGKALPTLAEEKKKVAEISNLQKAKKIYKDYVAIQEKIALDSKNIADLEAELEKTKDSSQVAFEERKQIKSELDALDALIDESREKGEKILAGRPEIQANLKKARDALNVEKEALAAYRDKKREEERERREKQREQQKAERAERDAKRKARDEERKKVEDLKVPYEDELYHCEVLSKYLEALLPQKPKETASPTATASSVPEGVTVLKKEKEEEFSSKKDNKKQNKVKVTQDLKHNVEVFLQFETLSLTPPSKLADVEASISELKAKREHYQKLSATALKEREEKAAAAAAAAAQAQAAEAANAEASASTTTTTTETPAGDPVASE